MNRKYCHIAILLVIVLITAFVLTGIQWESSNSLPSTDSTENAPVYIKGFYVSEPAVLNISRMRQPLGTYNIKPAFIGIVPERNIYLLLFLLYFFKKGIKYDVKFRLMRILSVYFHGSKYKQRAYTF